MLRGILLSLLTLGGVAFLVGGATFAPFSDTGDATGDVTAGTLTAALNGETTEATITFSTEEFCDNMAPGDVCTAEIIITNLGSLTGDIVFINAWIEDVAGEVEEGSCTWEPEFADIYDSFHWSADIDEVWIDVDNPQGGIPTQLLPAGTGEPPVDSTLITLLVYLDDLPFDEGNSVDDCQGSSATVVVRVGLEQGSDPHTDQDTGL